MTLQRIIYVPIEPLAERYSASWYKNIPDYFRSKQGWDVDTIVGVPLHETVKTGTFLDINSTVHYKNSQMAEIARLFSTGYFQDGDVFFFGDLEFWGLESIRLMAQMNHVDVKITGFLHAASYTKEDAFAVADYYQRYTEVGWLAACDLICVGSYYHKRAVVERRINSIARSDSTVQRLSSKIQVTGNPLFSQDYDYANYGTANKKKQLVISNRFDWEKRPNISLDFAYMLKRRHPDLFIVVCTSRPKFTSNRSWLVEYARRLQEDGVLHIRSGLTKEEYHLILAESKVMLTNTIEENFGYCVVEACLYGTWPVLQRAFSHPELVHGDAELLFNNEDEILPMVERLLTKDAGKVPYQYGAHYFSSMDRIAQAILSIAR